MITLPATLKISFTWYLDETKRRPKDCLDENRRPVDGSTPSSRPTAVSSKGWKAYDKNHKITAATLIHRATNLPNTDTGRNKEIERVYTALESNGYPVNLIADIERKKRVPPPVPTPEELVGMFFIWVDLPHTRGFATLPYIKGLTVLLTRLLRRHDLLALFLPHSSHFLKNFSTNLDICCFSDIL